MGPISMSSAVYKIRVLLFLALALCCHAVALAVDTHSEPSSVSAGSSPAEVLNGAFPSSLVFVPNRGQLINSQGNPQSDIAYSAVYNGVSLFFRADGISYVFTQKDPSLASGDFNQTDDVHMLASSRVDMVLSGANPNARIIPSEQTSEYFNFYYGHCPDGIVNVPGFSRLVYQDIYDNIDLVFYGTERGLKYDFVVRPGGDPRAISMLYSGANTPVITGSGGLQVGGLLGAIYEDTPFCYQETGKQNRVEVDGRFRLDGGTVKFDIGTYDASETLVIDPGILWATYLGGGLDDGALAVGTDAVGNVAISGYTESVNFPVTVGAIQTTLAASTVDLFIAKLSSSGERLWTTYYGGNASDHGGVYRTGLAMSAAGSIVITGHSSGGSFPVTITSYAGGLTDAFLVKLSSAGQRMWATFCGGADADYGRDVAIDVSGNVYMVGVTWSTRGTFSTQFQNNKSDLSDAFIVKYASDGTAVTAAFFGGIGSDAGNAIALDQSNHIIIAGETGSNTLPLTAGSLQGSNGGSGDAFVAKFYNNSSLQLQWTTFLGGSGREFATGVATDLGGSVIVVGSTASSNFPVSLSAMQNAIGGGNDAFVTRITVSGQQMHWSTYYGGNGNDEAQVVRVDALDNVVVSGETRSSNLPLSMPTYQENLSGSSDAFLLRMNSIGQRNLATYYGGSNLESAYGLALSAGTMIVVGQTQSPNLPVSIAAVQKSNAGGLDALVAKFGECNVTVDIVPSGPTTLCLGSSVVLDAGEGYSAYLWSNGETTRTINVDKAGTYAVTVIGIGGCQATDSIRIIVNPIIHAGRDMALCKGDIGVLSVVASSSVGNLQYHWSPSKGLRCTDCPNPEVVVDETTVYRVTVTDDNGCQSSTTITVSVNAAPVVDAGDDRMVCPGDMVPLFATGGTTYSWSPAEGLTCLDCQGPLAVFPMEQPSKTYYVVVTGENGCSTIDSVTLFAKSRPVAVAGPDTTVCAGTKVRLAGSGGSSYLWEPASDFDCPTCQYPTATVAGDREYTLTVTDASGCTSQDKVKVFVRSLQPISSPSPKIDFGQLGECESSAIQSAVINNTSGERVTIETIAFTNSNIFSRVDKTGRPMPAGPLVLEAGTSDTLYFLFVPQAATTVTEHVALQGISCSGDFTFELTGRKTSMAVNTGSVSVMNFGSTLTCDLEPRDTTIVIYNTGSSDIAVRAISSGPFVVRSPDISPTRAVVIRPGDIYNLQLRFSAFIRGTFSEDLRLPYESGSCSGEMRIPLMATRSLPAVRASASEMAFPVILGCESSSDTAIVFENTGDIPMEITNVDDNSIFQLGSSLPFTLMPGESRALTLRFRPPTAGVFSKVLTFTGEPCGITHSVTVNGVKQGVGFELSEEAIRFPALVLCRSTTADTMLTIINTSADNIAGKVKNVVVTGPFSTTLQPGDLISSGRTHDFGVQLATMDAGVHTGTISLVLEPCDIVKTITLSAEIFESGIITETVSTDFGQIPVAGTVKKTIRFRNTGSTGMEVVALEDLPAPFSVISTEPALPAVLAPGQVLTAEVQYSGTEPGVHSAIVRAVVEEPCSLTATAEIRGETTSKKLPVIAAVGIDFGKVQIKTPKTENLVISNTGNADAQIETLVLALGTRFSIDTTGMDFPYTLPPGEELIVPVRFLPNEAVAVSGRIDIAESAGTTSVELFGIGIDEPTGFAAIDIPRTMSADVHARDISVPVYLTTARDIEPGSAAPIILIVEIQYNPNVFNYTAVVGGEILSIRRENNRGILEVMRKFTAAPQSGELLFQLKGDVLLGNEKATELIIENVRWESTTRTIVTERTSGLLTITGICEEGGDRLLETVGSFGITSITPNPSGGPVEITVSTVEYAETHLEIYNAFGKLAYEKVWVPSLNVQTGSASSTHAVVVDTELPSGLYFVVLTSPARKATAHMVIEK